MQAAVRKVLFISEPGHGKGVEFQKLNQTFRQGLIIFDQEDFGHRGAIGFWIFDCYDNE
jgi:hypothetical protein